MEKFKYVFGPILSRRLGRSLGVDLVTAKSCSLDCIYCEAGRTDKLGCKRSEMVPADEVIAELERKLSTAPELDSITFSGKGEPLLNSQIGKVVDFLKSRYPQYPVTLLTNGIALCDKAVWQEIAAVDTVIPSLDGSNAAEFCAADRPAPGVDFDLYVRRLAEFTAQFKGNVDLEIFVLPGINDSAESIGRFAQIVSTLKLRSIQLNTLDRPAPERGIEVASDDTLKRFTVALAPFAPCSPVKPMRRNRSYFRPAIDALEGYTPGEQPKFTNLIKLNTNENPYPPSPAVKKALDSLEWEKLNRYPDPTSDALRKAVAEFNKVKMENVIIGNGSDDLLTMIFRSFSAPGLGVAVLEPSYSLYPVLRSMQEAELIRIPLDEARDFALPNDFSARAAGANLLLITCPNAPTGNTFPMFRMREICAGFDGIVVIDEAYADFADSNCMELAREFDHVLVMRTFSKSYGLAGLRVGYAVGAAPLIEGLMKLKDSYNVDRIAQSVALAAFTDREYFNSRVKQIREQREKLTRELKELGFRVIPSQSNFLFASPPDGDGKRGFLALREQAVVVRYFAGPVTGKYLRITVGTPEECQRLMEVLRSIY